MVDFPPVSAYTENSKKGWLLNAQNGQQIIHCITKRGTRKLTRAFLQAIIFKESDNHGLRDDWEN